LTRGADASLSFNEIEALATKAARGAGLGWGHAEDLGRGARWLAERGLNWSGPLLRLLDSADAAARLTSTMQTADRASSAIQGECWTTEGDADPVYLVPLLAASIYGRDIGLALRWPGLTMRIASEGSASASHAPIDLDDVQGPLTIEGMADTDALAHAVSQVARPAAVPSTVHASLSIYAGKTAVPASAASRTRGAGSTRSDND